MANGTFENMIQKERARLDDLRVDALKRRSVIDEEIAGIDTELRAIDAYDNAKLGKKRSTGARAPRTGGKRDSILKLIADNPAGMARADILEGLGVKGNKLGEQSVSNALSNLKKQGKLTQKDGKYIAA